MGLDTDASKSFTNSSFHVSMGCLTMSRQLLAGCRQVTWANASAVDTARGASHGDVIAVEVAFGTVGRLENLTPPRGKRRLGGDEERAVGTSRAA